MAMPLILLSTRIYSMYKVREIMENKNILQYLNTFLPLNIICFFFFFFFTINVGINDSKSVASQWLIIIYNHNLKLYAYVYMDSFVYILIFK